MMGCQAAVEFLALGLGEGWIERALVGFRLAHPFLHLLCPVCFLCVRSSLSFPPTPPAA
jgi:hypothetical protein